MAPRVSGVKRGARRVATPGTHRPAPRRSATSVPQRDRDRLPGGETVPALVRSAVSCRGGCRGRSAPAGGSLDGDLGAGALEGGLRLVRSGLVDLLQDDLGGAVDQVLGLLQAQAGERAPLLDALDLLVAGGLEDDVELVLLLDGLGGGATSGATSGGDGDGGGGLDVERLLEPLHEVGELDEGHLLERVEELVGAELRHGGGVLPVPALRVDRAGRHSGWAGSPGGWCGRAVSPGSPAPRPAPRQTPAQRRRQARPEPTPARRSAPGPA